MYRPGLNTVQPFDERRQRVGGCEITLDRQHPDRWRSEHLVPRLRHADRSPERRRERELGCDRCDGVRVAIRSGSTRCRRLRPSRALRSVRFGSLTQIGPPRSFWIAAPRLRVEEPLAAGYALTGHDHCPRLDVADPEAPLVHVTFTVGIVDLRRGSRSVYPDLSEVRQTCGVGRVAELSMPYRMPPSAAASRSARSSTTRPYRSPVPT